MTTYYFTCKKCRSKFEVEQPEPSRNVHLLLGLLTLGLWLVIYSFYQMFYFYRMSKCEDCGKRSKKLLTLLIVSSYLTVEILSGVYYFLEIAPAKIAHDLSTIEIPETMDLESDITQEQYMEVIKFIMVFALMPALGMYVYQYWMYILLIWFTIIVLLGYSLSSRYSRQ